MCIYVCTIRGIRVALACNRGSHGGIIKGDFKILFACEKTPRISLCYKLVPSQYRGDDYGLLKTYVCSFSNIRQTASTTNLTMAGGVR